MYNDDGVRRVTKWAHLKQLYHFESERPVKFQIEMKFPLLQKPTERKRVSTCVRVFFETSYNALHTQSEISEDKNDTALFINKVLTWWKILNVKSLQIDKLCNDPLQAEIRYLNDTVLDFIIEFGKMALNKAGSQGNHKKQLAQNTCYCHTSYLQWNCWSMLIPFSYKS